MSHLDRSLELEQNGLGNEDLASLGAEVANLGLEQLDLLARAAAPHLQEAVDYRVEIDFVLVRHLDEPSVLLGQNDNAHGWVRCGSDRSPEQLTERKLDRRRTRETEFQV